MIRVVLFDFGGVIAEEGFYQGLRVIAEKSGLEADTFIRTAEDLIHRMGYVTGRATEKEYWATVREKTGITQADVYLREQIFARFVVRPGMLAHADKLRASGRKVGILSDQTDWLDELNRRSPFYGHFDRVYNSYTLRKSKRDATVFADICRDLAVAADEVLFVDDNIHNVTRAASVGLLTIHFVDAEQFARALEGFGL